MLRSSLRVTERPDDGRLQSSLTIVNAAAADALTSRVTVVEHDFLEDSVRTLNLAIDIEGGDGVLARVPLTELGEALTLSESLDGPSELVFTRTGTGQVPMRSGHHRGPQRVTLAIARGTLGGERWWNLFDGYTRDVDVETYPCQAAVQAQDGSLLDRPLFYTLAARSYRSRKSVWLDICRQNRITPGAFNAPNEGGYVNKEINEGGNRTIRAFFQDYLAPTGYRCRWNGRAVDVIKPAMTDPAVRSLTWADLHAMPRVTPPATNTANVVRLASSIFGYSGPDLTGVTNTAVDTPGPYIPLAATQKQDHITGVITNVSPSVSSQPTLSQVATTTTRDGGNIVTENVIDYGWYAPKACKNRRLVDGTIMYNNQFDVYKYADNTWRTQPTETWQALKRRLTVKSYDANGWLLWTKTNVYDMTAWELTIATINSGQNGQEVNIERLVTEDGRAWENGAETLRWVQDDTIYPSLDPLGQVIRLNWTSTSSAAEAFRGPVVPPAPGPVYSGPNIYVFGPLAAKRYATRAVGSIVMWAAGQVLTPNAANDSYTQATSNHVNPLGFLEPVQRSVPPASGTIQVPGPLPLREQLSRLQVPQPASVDFRDAVRVALTKQEILGALENAWCETLAEMNAAAIKAAQELGAFEVSVTTDVDPRLRPGVVIALPAHSELVPDLALLVHSSTITINGGDFTGTQELACWWLPPELR